MYGGKDHDKAGEIANEVLKGISGKVKVGAQLAEVCEQVESEIISLGGQPAFPCSVAVNEYAAHYAPLFGDKSTIPENSIVKVDFGVHINGYICDCATTLNFNPALTHLEKASKESLRAAVEVVREGVTIAELGATIHGVMKRYNVNPVFNLTGHTLGRYTVHAGLSILNHDNNVQAALSAGDVIAIETFSSTGAGYVHDRGRPGIYAIVEPKNVRNAVARKILSKVYPERQTLPFAERWLHKIEGSGFAIQNALKDMEQAEVLLSYPPLSEQVGAMVSQHECTLLVEKNGFHVIGGDYR
ncbi:MAG: type II methionyl aminopeptidase [Candidatus Micrarchaeota archaeon]|nr:type II methionyl aminopeptidase [Candidatus Micrarchaeota archaeon]